ncbi:uncharacterized protein LOC119164633 isoform X2 [Rhipicephalus microplus]|uniref:uncharacterized protein LOC119164633 isoform X2 n=1 Tax=Rhipicephalus microplus TaxID=6941 RepID=UPI003F6B5CAC
MGLAHCAYQYRQVWLGLQGHTQKPRMLGSSHIPERSTLAAAARPHMEPRMFGSSCSPRHAYVTGAARPQTDPQMLAFMEPTL